MATGLPTSFKQWFTDYATPAIRAVLAAVTLGESELWNAGLSVLLTPLDIINADALVANVVQDVVENPKDWGQGMVDAVQTHKDAVDSYNRTVQHKKDRAKGGFFTRLIDDIVTVGTLGLYKEERRLDQVLQEKSAAIDKAYENIVKEAEKIEKAQADAAGMIKL